MKLNKGYYQYLIERMAKVLLREKNKIAQTLDKELKECGKSFGYANNDIDIVITFRKKKGSDKE